MVHPRLFSRGPQTPGVHSGLKMHAHLQRTHDALPTHVRWDTESDTNQQKLFTMESTHSAREQGIGDVEGDPKVQST
jgi:hypothetical protein